MNDDRERELGDEIERMFPGKKEKARLQQEKELDERILYNLIQKLNPHQRRAVIELLSSFTIASK